MELQLATLAACCPNFIMICLAHSITIEPVAADIASIRPRSLVAKVFNVLEDRF
jgi:hypothetical protein